MYGRQESDHPQEKETQKGKMGIEEALQRVVKRREAKSKGEKERHTYLNAEFQRIARRDKKAFLRQLSIIKTNHSIKKMSRSK